MPERGDFLLAEGGADRDRAVASEVQHQETALGARLYPVTLQEGDQVIFPGGEELDFDQLVGVAKTHWGPIIIYSSHATLLRDYALAERRQRRGHDVSSPSILCVLYGLDKLAMKRFFRSSGILTPI